ncbi:MAG TPA: OmpA family protein [Gemmatimonadales bacterium]|jgi:outer membrane protein OmpA-like peptidoglycan-associated protein|nr:OmpA family protein [Gemmatimonadales bacterium]
MSSTLLDSFRNLLTPDTVSSVASRFGESESGISRGLTSGFGAILLGLLNQTSDAGAMRDVHGLVTEAAADTNGQAEGGLTSLLGGGGTAAVGTLGSRLLSMVFGGNGAAVSDAIGRTSGVKSTTASSILSILAPVVLGILGRRVRDEGLSANGLTSLLASEADSIRNMAPAGLASLFGLGTSAAPGARPTVEDETSRRAGGLGWVWLAVAAAVILGIIWFASRTNGPVNERMAMDTTMAPAGVGNDSTDVQAYSPRGNGSVVLPNGNRLTVPDTSLEARVVAFITDSNVKTDKDTWFNFDRLRFETGSATLAPESDGQLRNLAAILGAYPDVHAKIGGYTDSTGNDDANKTLSENRARNVMNQLVALGVDKGRLESEGYGEEHPVASNATEAGRAQNRRIALRVTEK